jgi:Mrp family chromosome partitioning ATPase
MTALDRAIINAYHRPKSRPGARVAELPAPRNAASPAVPLSQALAELAAAPVTPAAAAADEPANVEPAPAAESTSAFVVPASAGSVPRMPPTMGTWCPGGTTSAPVGSSITAMLDKAIRADPAHSETIDVFAATSAALTAMPSMPPETVTISAPSAEAGWQPLLQVDRVVWPSIHNRLQTSAPAAIEQLTAGLLSICKSGSKILGLASCAGGEGVTTLLLAAARKLLKQGQKVVLVDANWNNPQLAQSLGLLPQIGWEETLSDGLPLEEVVIESLDDGLAVLPIREQTTTTIDRAKIAASLDILAREFDVVLVDLGPLARHGDEDVSWHEATAEMDAVILVQNVRTTTPNRLAAVRERLAECNVRHAGTIQNFVVA